MSGKKKSDEKIILLLIALVGIVLIGLIVFLVITVSSGKDEGNQTDTDYTAATKYAKVGDYSEVAVLPAGKNLAITENSPSVNKGVRVLFNFPDDDEDSYIIKEVANNELNITNSMSGAILQMRVVNSNGVIMVTNQLKKHLPDLKPYDWDGYSVYEWTEHGDNKNFYLHYFFESKDKTLGWGYVFVAAMEYTEGVTTDYEWGKEIFRKVKVEEVTISE